MRTTIALHRHTIGIIESDSAADRSKQLGTPAHLLEFADCRFVFGLETVHVLC